MGLLAGGEQANVVRGDDIKVRPTECILSPLFEIGRLEWYARFGIGCIASFPAIFPTLFGFGMCVCDSRSRLKFIYIYLYIAGAPLRLSCVDTTCVCTAYGKSDITNATYICVSCIFKVDNYPNVFRYCRCAPLRLPRLPYVRQSMSHILLVSISHWHVTCITESYESCAIRMSHATEMSDPKSDIECPMKSDFGSHVH